MAVSKNLFIDLATDPLTDWQQHGGGAQTNTTLEPDCSFTLHEELSTDKCWLLEAVLSVNAAPVDPDGARLWAYFHKHDPASYSMDTYFVQVRLEDNAGTKQLVLYDGAATPAPAAVATLNLDQGWDWTDNVPRIRVRLRLDVDAAGTTRTLHLEAEPSDDPLFDKSAASLSVSKDLDEAGSECRTLDGSLLEFGFGNFGTESSDWESVHLTVADKGTALPYWPAPVTPDVDHDTPVDNIPGFRIFSPAAGEATIEFDCQINPADNYLDGDDLTLSLEVTQGPTPADRAYGSVPAGLDSHTFTGLDDEQSVTGKATVCDVSGRCTEQGATIVVDHSGPTLTITSVTPLYANAGSEVAVEFTTNEPLDDSTIHVTVGGQDMTRDGTGTTPYRFIYTPTGAETPGPQTVMVQADDPTGNTSQDTDVGGVTLDFIDPTIDAAGASVDTPFVADGQTFNLYVDVTDVGSDVDSADVTLTLDARPLTFVDQTGPTFQFEYTVDEAVDSAGPQTVVVHALDLAGNETTEDLTTVVIFDFDPPSVSLTDSPAIPVGDNQPFTITLNVTDDYATVDDATFTVTVGGQILSEGTFADPSFEFTGTASSGVSTEGLQDIVVTVRDEAGNEGSQTFPDAVTFDFAPPVVSIEDAPSAPVGDGMVHVTLDVTDVLSAIDTSATFQVTLGGRAMIPGGFADPSFPFSLTVDSGVDTEGAQDLVVTVRDTAGNETTETFPAAVSYDFVGPVIVVDDSPTDPVTHGATVDVTLNVTDDYSQIDIGPSFVVTLGGRTMTPGTFTHPSYPFSIDVDSALDTPGAQDLEVTVRDSAGNQTVQTFSDLVTYDFTTPAALVNEKITLVCAKGDDGLFHQQYDPELQISALPGSGLPYTWVLTDIDQWNDITEGTITVTIDPYADSVWQALPDGDPRKEPIRLAAIVPVAIDVPNAVWLEESDPAVTTNPWIRFVGTVDGDPFTVTVFLRTLTSDVYLVFEKQSRAGLVQLSQPSEPGTVVTWGAEALNGFDTGFSVGFAHDAGDTEQVGARIEISHTAGDWPALGASGDLLDPDDLADATFDLKLSQTGHADSYLPCDVRLRKLIGDRHLVFFGQVYQDDHPAVLWKESAFIAATGETLSGRAVDGAGVELAPQPMVFNELLGLAATPDNAPPSGVGDPPWNVDQTFHLQIKASDTTVVPASYFDSRGLHYREFSPEVLTLVDPLSGDFGSQLPGPHDAPITVAGSAETWVFGDMDDFDLDSILDADLTTLNTPVTTLVITWDAGDLQPTETGELAVVMLRADDADVPLSPPVRVSVPVLIRRDLGLRVLHGASSTTALDKLPDAYHQLRYKGELEALVYDLQDDDVLEWSLDDSEIDAVIGAANNPLELEKPGEQTYVAANPDSQAQHNAVQTQDEPVAAVIPDTLTAPATYTLLVSVTHLRPLAGGGFKEIASGAGFDLTLGVHETPDNFDVAILLDRSGSMSGDRWQTACDGADLFATLINETGVDSRVGVYWFWGDNSSAPDNYPNDATYHSGEGYHGTFPAASSTPADQRLTLDTNRAVAISDPGNAPPEVYDVCHADGPDHYTALGSGLLHCRDELMKHAADSDSAGNTRGRMILLLSDGMENRKPKLDPVFFSAPDDHWNFFEAPGEGTKSVHAEGPGVRIHSVAMLTSDAWANKLRDVAAETGGLWALDVQHIRPNKASDALALTENWFLTSFAGIFDFDESAVMVDPALAAGATATQSLTVNLGMDTLVFYQLSGAADLDKWDFTVKLPDTDLELTPALAAAHDGITYRHGKMYQMYVVRTPLAIPGHEHRWPGEWTMRLTRKAGTGTGHYGLGALSRQDLQCRVDVLTRPRPRPGDEATIEVQLRDRHGNRIRKARVSTRVYTPGPWAGDIVARRVASDPRLVAKLRKSSSKSNQDLGRAAERVLRHLIDKGALKSGRTYNQQLREVSPGLYRTRIKLPEAGHYQLDTTVNGEQRFSTQKLTALLKPHLRRLRRSLPLAQLTKELGYLRKRHTTRQPFSWAAARHLAVLFAPDVKESPTEGWFLDDEVIRLDVKPTDKEGRLLGPGWADQLTFTAPAGASQHWPATDAGDGHYWVEIPFHARNPRFELLNRALVADRLELGHPDGRVRLLQDRMPLTGFAAHVLGVRIPITVQALVGNRATREAHLATCQYARKISPKNRVLFHDLEDASKAGFDTCEHCLPLICNMDPDHQETHKPFCTWAHRIAPKNQLEVHSIKAALALGFNGCAFCLPKYHDE